MNLHAKSQYFGILSFPKVYSFVVKAKTMNIVFKFSIIACACILMGTLTSCTKTCDAGYEGKRCDVEIREKFEGAWNALDNPGNFAYTDTISKGTGVLDVLILRRFGADTFARAIKA